VFSFIVEASPSAIWKADNDKDLPLHHVMYAIDENHLISDDSADKSFKVRILLEAAGDVAPFMARRRNSSGKTPLHVLCSHMWGELRVVKKLLSLCPDLFKLVDSDGNTPLHLAAYNMAPIKVLRKLCSHEKDRCGSDKCPTMLKKNFAGNRPIDLIKLVTPKREWRDRWKEIKSFLKTETLETETRRSNQGEKRKNYN